MRKPEITDASASTVPLLKSDISGRVLGTTRILIADDDQESRNLLSEVLQANGYSVRAVGDGLAAREELARDGKYLVVIADLRMPKESGLDLLRSVRQQNPKQPVILMSSFISESESRQAKELGAQALLEKPFRLAELLQAVEGLLQQKPFAISP